jgi:hypothetical protein
MLKARIRDQDLVSSLRRIIKATTVSSVTAAEIIEEIKRLPPSEQMEVIKFCCELVQEKEQEFRTIPDAEFRRAADEVFEKYHDLLRRLADA